MSFSPASLASHHDWTVSRWVAPLLQAPAVQIADLGVMTLGLSGEVAEVADVVEDWASSGICDSANLVKELGDVFFYWSRLSARFDQVAPPLEQASACLTACDPMCVGCPAAKPPVLEVLRMVKAAGTVSETVKKYLRDSGLDREKLARGMAELYLAWHAVCQASGIRPEDVVQANRDKVEGRVVRGTQRGSGDNR